MKKKYFIVYVTLIRSVFSTEVGNMNEKPDAVIVPPLTVQDSELGKKRNRVERPINKLMGIEYVSGQYNWIVDSNSVRSFLPVIGKVLVLSPQSRKYCFGVYNILTHTSSVCPKSRVIDPRYRNCYSCLQDIGFNPSFYNVPHSSLSENQQIYNLTKHHVYLAAFSKDIIKVGIAQCDRLMVRLTEQGARCAIVLGDFEDAYKAREMEISTIKKYKLAEGVTMPTKMKVTKGPLDPTEKENISKKLLEIYGQVVGNAAKDEVLDFDEIYFGSDAKFSVVKSTTIKNDIEGRVFGAVGDILFLETRDGRVKVNIKPHYGSLTFTEPEV